MQGTKEDWNSRALLGENRFLIGEDFFLIFDNVELVGLDPFLAVENLGLIAQHLVEFSLVLEDGGLVGLNRLLVGEDH